jgi:hypothetical protein
MLETISACASCLNAWFHVCLSEVCKKFEKEFKFQKFEKGV